MMDDATTVALARLLSLAHAPVQVSHAFPQPPNVVFCPERRAWRFPLPLRPKRLVLRVHAPFRVVDPGNDAYRGAGNEYD